LTHRNILPLLGIADYANICPGGSRQLCLISPWTSGGNTMEYLKSNPTVSPLPFASTLAHLPQLLHIVDDISYLHSHPSGPIIHGDLQGVSVITRGNGSSLK
ncbi:hypothetical protein CALVIDRAFT_489142, partial [Calocera viscosa TUFC12733]